MSNEESHIPTAIKAAGQEAEKVKAEVLGTQPAPQDNPQPSDQVQTLNDDIATLTAKKAQLERDINTLNGTYGARLQKVKQQLDSVTANAKSLESENADLKRELAEALANPSPKPDEDDDTIIDLDGIRDILGDDFVREYGEDMARGLIKVNQVMLKRYQDKNAKAGKGKETPSASPPSTTTPDSADAEAERKANEEAFWSAVETSVPDARILNESDAGWLSFLGQVDPATGQTRLAAGNDAIKRGDINAVVELYEAYFANRDAQSQPGAAPVPQESQVDPKSVRSGSGQPQATKTLSMADWDSFQREVTKFPNRYSIEEVNQRNNEYRTALMEGRLK